MSDLHQAVQAEIAAHTPTLPPSFEALKARRRTRDRRRTGAAVAVSALAVAGIAFVPSTFLGDTGRPAQVAQPGDAETFDFAIRATNTTTVIQGGEAGSEAVQQCLKLPGLDDVLTRTSYPPLHAGTVTGRDNADALTDCVAAVPGWGVTLTPPASPAETRTYTVRPSVKTVANPRLEEQRDGCFALPGVQTVGQGESMPVIYRVTVSVAEALAFEQCIAAVVGLHVPELGQADDGAFPWTGARICAVGESEECRTVDAETARTLDALFLAAEPAPAGTITCGALNTLYRITFQHPSARPIPVSVPYMCGPLKRGDQDYILDSEGREAVKAAFEAGAPVA